MIRNHVFVEYINKQGNLSNKEDDIIHTIVKITNIFTTPDGKDDKAEQICNLYVGDVISIEKAINNNIAPLSIINELKKNGTSKIIINETGIHPFKPYDKAFQDKESMLEELNKQLERLEMIGYSNDNTINKQYRKTRLKKESTN